MFENERSRRELLLAGAAGAAASVLNRTAFAAEKKAAKASAGQTDQGALPAVIKTSVAAYSFRTELDSLGKPGKMTLLDLTEMAARWKLDAIEPTSYYFLKTDDEYLMQLKRKVFLAGLEISGTPINNDFCQKAGPELDKSIAHVKEWVDYSVKLGSPAMRIFAGKTPKDADKEETFKRVIAAMKIACEYAGQKGVFLTLENHGSFIQTADDVLRICEGVKSDWLGVNLDTGNFMTDPYKQMAKLAPLAVTCQIKYQVHENGQPQEADFQKIIGILREHKYRGYVALEYEGKDPHKEVPMYLEKIKDAIRATA